MNNLYKNIYNAINEGISKGLHQIVIDDNTEQDVKYQHNRIHSVINNLPILVKQLLEDSDCNAVYKNILYQYKNNGSKYIIKNLHNFFKIYNKIKYNTSATNINIDWLDCKDIDEQMEYRYHISYILENDKEIPIASYNKGMDVKFIKIDYEDKTFQDDFVRHNAILIHKNLFIAKNLQWWYGNNLMLVNQEKCFPGNPHNDYNGYANTYFNVNIRKKQSDGTYKNDFSNYPGHQYVNNIDMPGYTAYIPSYGEMLDISTITDAINYTLIKAGNKKSKILPMHRTHYIDKTWATSTEADSRIVYGLRIESPTEISKTNAKNTNLLPIFKNNKNI